MMSLTTGLCIALTPPNNQGERREATAADVRFVSEADGSLPFAPPCGLGAPDGRFLNPGSHKNRSRPMQSVGMVPE